MFQKFTFMKKTCNNSFKLQTAYKFCRRPRSMFLDLSDCQTVITSNNLKDTKVSIVFPFLTFKNDLTWKRLYDNFNSKVLTKLPESSKVEIKPRTQRSLHAEETVSEMQKVSPFFTWFINFQNYEITLINIFFFFRNFMLSSRVSFVI